MTNVGQSNINIGGGCLLTANKPRKEISPEITIELHFLKEFILINYKKPDIST